MDTVGAWCYGLPMTQTNATIVLDTDEQIYMFRLLSMAHSLAFEIRTGMKMSRISALKVARADGITKSNRKPAALRDVVAAIQARDPEYVPSKQIQEALA